MRKPLEKRRCDVCGACSLRRVTMLHEETVTHDGRAQVIRVPDLSVIRCTNPECRPEHPDDTIILDDDAIRRIDVETYRQLGLLTPPEIRAHRERLGLTQQELADLLRLGGNSLSRWESGAVYQSRSLDTLLRMTFGMQGVVEFLTARASADSEPRVPQQPKFRYLEPDSTYAAPAFRDRIRTTNSAVAEFGRSEVPAHV